MRETQIFIEALRIDRSRVVSVSDLTDILNSVPGSRWTIRIGEGLGALAREVNDCRMPVADVIEWMAEWSQESWGAQRGLKLLTARRAKGLEFEDVVILDGGWRHTSRNEDQDAPRRLFYVAMTRARRNLIVMSSDNHAFLPAQSPAIVRRSVTPDLSTFPGPRRYFPSAEERMVDLSFPGRQGPNHPVLSAIAEAKVGDAIHLVHRHDQWHIKDRKGRSLGRMAGSFEPPTGTTFSSGEIAAILRWKKAYGDEDFHHTLRRDSWEVVVPELVFAAS